MRCNGRGKRRCQSALGAASLLGLQRQLTLGLVHLGSRVGGMRLSADTADRDLLPCANCTIVLDWQSVRDEALWRGDDNE